VPHAQLVDGAVAAGLLVRTTAPHDRRAHHLTLTAAGARKLHDAHAELGQERDVLGRVVGSAFPVQSGLGSTV
jgi:DNA-binding MarR family transcriptional regulator